LECAESNRIVYNWNPNAGWNNALRLFLLSLILSSCILYQQNVAKASTPSALYGRGGGTTILDQDALLAGYAEPGWYKNNIPFLEVPDEQIQGVYYYRWSTYKRHLRYTTPEVGYIVTEFVHSVNWAAPYDAINAAAGHHIYEGRWLKNQRYLNDYETYWLRGPGRTYVRQYSFWAADAYYARYLVNGDKAFIVDLLPDLIQNYNAWQNHYDSNLGLYWQTPHLDGMEFTIGSYQTADPFGGGAGFRPSINAYMYGDAQAISHIATLAGDTPTTTDFSNRAARIKSNLQEHLWDPDREFFFHMMRDDNPNHTLLDGREEIGFIPWYFNMPDSIYSSAWSQLMAPQGFYAPFGPTTAERRHRLFMYEALKGCCRWDGMSWPYATSQTLTAMANLLNNYAQNYVTKEDYFTLLENYTISQHKNGHPYVAEALHPDTGVWLYDGFNFSEHYNHSTYNDLIITGLIGIRPRPDNTFEVNPLVPDSWDYFCLENVPYHGHLMTVLWDRTGTRYGKGPGLQIFQDGALIASSPTITRLLANLIPLPPLPVQSPRLENYAANVSGSGYPMPIASYTSPADDVWQAVDGRIYYDDIPDSRWTNYQSPNVSDWLGIDFGMIRPVNQVKLYIYDDGHSIRTPASYTVQYWNGNAWIDVAHPLKTPLNPRGNDVNTITFTEINTRMIRVIFPDGAQVGITELEVWYPNSPGFCEVNACPYAAYLPVTVVTAQSGK